jgi:hypothetical protein
MVVCISWDSLIRTPKRSSNDWSPGCGGTCGVCGCSRVQRTMARCKYPYAKHVLRIAILSSGYRGTPAAACAHLGVQVDLPSMILYSNRQERDSWW